MGAVGRVLYALQLLLVALFSRIGRWAEGHGGLADGNVAPGQPQPRPL